MKTFIKSWTDYLLLGYDVVFLTHYNHLKEGCSQIGLSSQVTGRTWTNSLTLLQRRFKLDVGKIYSSKW